MKTKINSFIGKCPLLEGITLTLTLVMTITLLIGNIMYGSISVSIFISTVFALTFIVMYLVKRHKHIVVLQIMAFIILFVLLGMIEENAIGKIVNILQSCIILTVMSIITSFAEFLYE